MTLEIWQLQMMHLAPSDYYHGRAFRTMVNDLASEELESRKSCEICLPQLLAILTMVSMKEA